MKPKSTEHSDLLKVSYLDASLAPEEHSQFEALLAEDPQLRREMTDLDQIAKGLREEKDLVFCPPQWKLFEYAEGAHDSDKTLTTHIGRCEVCQQRIAAYKADLATSNPVPVSIRKAFEAQFPKPNAAAGEIRNVLATLREYVSSLFNVPVMALSAAAAAILVVILLYPHGQSMTVVGLSSTEWQKPQGPMVFMRPGTKPTEKPERMAVVLFFKGFNEPVPQQRIDGLYEALTPSAQLWSRYDFVEPGKIKEAVTETGSNAQNETKVLTGIHQTVKATQALKVTLIRQETGFAVEAARIDLATGRTLLTRKETSVTEQDLPNRLKDVMVSALR